MVLINYATKEIVAKVVYYGPALCGKTTNLQFVYSKLSPKKRGKMISLSTESDRTLFFDFLPMELGKIQGFKVRFQLYTVPGQVFYGATRRLVLKGADAVVFVADSQEAVLDMNIESIEDMKQNLIENNIDPETIPLVMQYNKRDLNGIMGVEELEKQLNWRGVPYTEAEAITGPGVMETFMEVTKELIQDLKKKHAFIGDDAIKEISPDMFEQEKEPEPEVLEADDVVLEIEHGSGYRHETGGEDVVAGEMLDMVETISLADATLAEEFFDDVRKGVPTEEAKEKVLGAGAGEEKIELSSPHEAGEGAVEVVETAENPLRVGERELTPEELEFAEEPVEAEIEAPALEEEAVVLEADPFVEPVKPAAEKEKPKKSAPKPKPAARAETGKARKAEAKPPAETKEKAPAAPRTETEQHTEKRFESMQETLALLAKDVSVLGGKLEKHSEARPAAAAEPDKRIDVILDVLTGLAKDLSSLSVKLDDIASREPSVSQAAPALQEPDRRIDTIIETVSNLTIDVSQLGQKLDTRPEQSTFASGGQDITPELYEVKDSLGRIEQEISALRLTLTMMKESTSNAIQAAGPGGTGGPELKAMFDELRKELQDSFEGQDRLMLSILEASRETRKANADSHDKLEDAIRYIVSNIKGDGGKKKW